MATAAVSRDYDDVNLELLGPSLVRPKQNFEKFGTEDFDNEAPLYQAPEPPVEDWPFAMPREAMYGWLGDKAKSLGMPLGWAYTACLTVFAGMGINVGGGPYGQARPTLYSVLVGKPEDGKSLVQDRSVATLKPGDCVKYTTPGSDKGLAKMFSTGGKKAEPMELRPYVLVLDELRTMMKKADIQGSALAPTLCQLWNKDKAGSADSKGDHSVNVHLSILGALAVEDPSDFATLFGNETQGGLYSRFLIAPGPPTAWDIDYNWMPDEGFAPRPVDVTVPSWCNAKLKSWLAAGSPNKPRKRIGELAMRVAIISASANGETTITPECLAAALRMMEWQEEVRAVYAAGVALNDEARLTSAVLDAMQAAGVDEEGDPRWVNKSKLASEKNWYRKYSGTMLERVFAALRKEDGPLKAKYHERKCYDGDGMEPDYSRPTGMYRLKGALDED